MQELAEIFDIKGISKSPAIFDIEKLKYFNAEYIRAMSPEAFAKAAEPFIRQAVKKPEISAAAIAALLQQRTEVLTARFLRRAARVRHGSVCSQKEQDR